MIITSMDLVHRVRCIPGVRGMASVKVSSEVSSDQKNVQSHS